MNQPLPLNTVYKFNPTIWGPHFWFFLHTVAESYPLYPNAVTKRKYYDLIQNMPLFIPIVDMGDTFSEMLDKYPVTPYLDTRASFVRWVHFIHNKFNVLLRKPEISLLQSLDNYRAEYYPKTTLYYCWNYFYTMCTNIQILRITRRTKYNDFIIRRCALKY
jgi:hypothetical protein